MRARARLLRAADRQANECRQESPRKRRRRQRRVPVKLLMFGHLTGDVGDAGGAAALAKGRRPLRILSGVLLPIALLLLRIISVPSLLLIVAVSGLLHVVCVGILVVTIPSLLLVVVAALRHVRHGRTAPQATAGRLRSTTCSLRLKREQTKMPLRRGARKSKSGGTLPS